MQQIFNYYKSDYSNILRNTNYFFIVIMHILNYMDMQYIQRIRITRAYPKP